MRKFIKTITLAAAFGGGVLSVSAQEVRARVGGLETDSTYMSLLREEHRMKMQEDSLLHIIRNERQRLTVDTVDIYNRSQQILRLEETVFGYRNQLGRVVSEINAIEQKFILDNLFGSGVPAAVSTTQQPSSNYPNLIDNDYFRENLSAEEYRELRAGGAANAELRELVERYKGHYERLEALAEAYAGALTQPAADSLHSHYRVELAAIRRVESGFETAWGDRYNQEVYLYSYLLDKLNRMDDLAGLNEKARARRAAVSGDGVMSVLFAEYPAQREALVDYELALANALNLTAAADSLDRVRRTVGGEDLSFPEIRLTEREFVNYRDVSFPNAPLYDNENPVPELWIPGSGTYYSVTVGTFSQRQPISIFRGVAPLAYERQRSGQWRYYVGLFRSYGDAAEAVETLKNAGFRRPEAVCWRDGVYENLVSRQLAGHWRIVVDAPDGVLPEEVRFCLNRYARNKEVTRAGNGNAFYVGTFTDQLHVEDVIQALGRLEGIRAHVEELED